MFERVFIAACISILAWGCSSESSQGEEKSIIVDSYKSPCFGESQQICMRTKLDNSNAFELFYGDIEGFDYSWGHEYKLNVKITDIDNPMTDGSSKKYQLTEILSSKEDQIGTLYEYNGVETLNSAFTKADGDYYFFGKSFECSSGTDCDALVSLTDSGTLVNVRFKYLGNAKIQLASWSKHQSVTKLLEMLNENLAKWKSHAITDYTITTSVSCFCLPEEDIVVTVNSNEIVDAYYTPSVIHLDASDFDRLKTIDKHFEIIQRELNEKNLDYVVYNDEYGFPEKISYGNQFAAVDGEVILNISNFE